MKQMIACMALILIQKNGQTTNLEIKNALRDQFRNDHNFKLYQSDVSQAMDEIAVEQGFVVTFDQVGGHQFRVFSLPQAPTTTSDDVTDDTVTGTSDDLSTLSKNALNGGTNGSDLSSTLVGTDGTLTDSKDTKPTITTPAGFGPQVDEAMGEFVAYWAKDTKVRAQGNDKKTLRTELTNGVKAQFPAIRYDDTRICSAKHYNKHVASR